MFLLKKPTEEEIDCHLKEQGSKDFSYREIGATREKTPPKNYGLNKFRGELGNGEKVYRWAIEKMFEWEMYRLDWTKIYPPQTPVKQGETLTVLVKHLGFWSLNPFRVVETFAEPGEIERAGFSIGTLPAHSEAGEERFTIEWDRRSDRVIYDLFAFAKPAALMAKLGFPFVRILQKRFAAESFKAMRAAMEK